MNENNIQIIVDKVIANYLKKVFNNFDLSKDKFGIIKNMFNDFINMIEGFY